MTNRVGLENYGATCYLNSTLQAIFRTKLYRQAIQQIPQDQQLLEQVADDKFSASPAHEVSPKLTVQALNYIFSQLQFSTKPYIDTKPFCRAKGMDDRALYVQEDANELFKYIVDKIDLVAKESNLNSLFKQYFEAEKVNVICCTECSYQSTNTENIIDAMCTIGPTMFDSLAQFLKPEEIDGYKCDGCKKQVLALKYCKFSHPSFVFIISVLRFAYDMYQDSYKKDSNPTAFPLAIDLEFLKDVDAAYFIKCNDIAQAISEALKIYMMPWIYIHDGKFNFTGVSQEVADIIQPQQTFIEAALRKYSGEMFDPYEKIQIDGSHVVAVQSDDPLYKMPATNLDTNTSLYVMSSVICHMGSINSGHYYMFSNELKLSNDRMTMEMWEYNDNSAFEIRDAVAQLQYIAGSKNKPKHLQQETGEKDQNKNEPTTGVPGSPVSFQIDGYGNTGYMYIYQNVHEVLKCEEKSIDQLIVSQTVKSKILEENRQWEDINNGVLLNVLTNYNKGETSMDAFSQLDSNGMPLFHQELKFDLRNSMKSLVDFLLQSVSQFYVTDVEQLKSLKFNIFVCDCYRRDLLQFQINRSAIVFKQELATEEILNNPISSVIQVQQSFNNFNHRKHQNRINLFLEFIPKECVYAPYDMQAKYIILQQVQCSTKKPTPEQMSLLSDTLSTIKVFNDSIVCETEQVIEFVGQTQILPYYKDLIAENIGEIYQKPVKSYSTYNLSVAEIKCLIRNILKFEPQRLFVFEISFQPKLDIEIVNDLDTYLYSAGSDKIFFEVLNEDIQCGIKNEKSKKLMMVSEIARQNIEYRNRIQVQIFDELSPPNLLMRRYFNPKQTIDDVVAVCKQQYDSEFGFALNLCKMQRQAGYNDRGQYIQETRLKQICQVTPNSRDFPGTYSVEKFQQAALQSGASEILLQLHPIRPKADNIIQFVIFSSTTYFHFMLFETFVSYQNGQTIEQVFEKALKFGAVSHQLTNQKEPYSLILNTSVGELFFFYCKERDFASYQEGKIPAPLNSSSLMNGKPMELKVYRQPFVCIVVHNEHKQVFDFKKQFLLVKAEFMQNQHDNVSCGYIAVGERTTTDDVRRFFEEEATKQGKVVQKVGYGFNDRGRFNQNLLHDGMRIHGNHNIWALLAIVI